MSDWYYTSNGQSTGPVSFETLQTLAASGHFKDPANLVWTQGMDEWATADNIPGLNPAAQPSAAPASPAGGPSSDADNPYAAPATVAYQPPGPVADRPDIDPGSDPLEPTQVLGASWRAFRNNIGQVFLFLIVYFVASVAINLIISAIFPPTTYNLPLPESVGSSEFAEIFAQQEQASLPAQLLGIVVNSFLALYLARFTLNLITSQEINPGVVLGESSKFWRVIAGTLVMYIILFLSVVPGAILLGAGVAMSDSGIGVALMVAGGALMVVAVLVVSVRFSLFTYSIIDRNTGPIDALRDSWNITKNNVWRFFLLGVLFLLISIGCVFTFGLGFIVALPVMMISSAVVYRWLRVGNQAASDII